MDDKGKPIPVIFSKRVRERPDQVEINLQHKQIDRRVFNQDQVGIDKIVEDSESTFYITGKTTKIPLLNFLQMVGKHDMAQVADKEAEEIVLASDLIVRIASAEITDEDEENMKFVDATVIGMFIAAFFLSGFALISNSLKDIATFSWILLLVSLLFLSHYIYQGFRSGDLQKYMRAAVKSLSKK